MKLYHVAGLAFVVVAGLSVHGAATLGPGDASAEDMAGSENGGESLVGSRFVRRPLPAASKLTVVCYERTKEAFYVQLFSRAYDGGQFRSEQWDADVRRLIGDYAKQASYDVNTDFLELVLKRSDALVAKGCQDPLAKYIRAVLLARLNRRTEELNLTREVKRELEAGGYAPFYRYLATRRLRLVLEKIGTQKELATLDAAKLKYLGMAAGDALLKANAFQRCYMEYFTLDCNDNVKMKDMQQCMREIEAPAAAVDPWIRAETSGIWHIRKGWQARGSGYGNEVNNDGQNQFASEIRLARKEFRAAYAMHPELPEAAEYMITVSMAGGDEDSTRQWFDRAVAAQFDYLPAYNKLVWSLYPRWNGSYTEMYDFAVECMKTKRYDTTVPFQFAETFRKILTDMRDIRPFCRRPGVYEDMTTCFREVLPRCNANMAYWQTWMVVVAWAAGRHEDARRYCDELGEKFTPEAVSGLKVDPVTVLGEIQLPKGLLRERYLAAEYLLAGNSCDEALTIYKELAETEPCKRNEAVSTLLKGRIELATRVRSGGQLQQSKPNDEE